MIIIDHSLMYSNSDPIVFRFQPSDSFIGYQADTPSAVVFRASSMVKPDSKDWEIEVSMIMNLK